MIFSCVLYPHFHQLMLRNDCSDSLFHTPESAGPETQTLAPSGVREKTVSELQLRLSSAELLQNSAASQWHTQKHGLNTFTWWIWDVHGVNLFIHTLWFSEKELVHAVDLWPSWETLTVCEGHGCVSSQQPAQDQQSWDSQSNRPTPLCSVCGLELWSAATDTHMESVTVWITLLQCLPQNLSASTEQYSVQLLLTLFPPGFKRE